MSKNNSETEKKSKVTADRLPCRGCTRSCKNYDRCDGRPWRTIGTDYEK